MFLSKEKGRSFPATDESGLSTTAEAVREKLPGSRRKYSAWRTQAPGEWGQRPHNSYFAAVGGARDRRSLAQAAQAASDFYSRLVVDLLLNPVCLSSVAHKSVTDKGDRGVDVGQKNRYTLAMSANAKRRNDQGKRMAANAKHAADAARSSRVSREAI